MVWYACARVMSLDRHTESSAGPGSSSIRLAFVLFAAQVAVWWSGLGGADLHRVLAAAGVAALLFAMWRARGVMDGPRCAWARFLDGPWVFLVLGLVYFAAWFAHMVARYHRFEFANFDLGIYSNVAFNTAHGRPFYSSILSHSHLGEHFSPITALFAPLYALKPTVYWLFGAQALSFAVVPLVLAHMCRDLLPDRGRANAVALGLSLLWGIYPPMAAAMRFPFHPTSLAAPWVLLAFLYVERADWRRAVPVLLLLLAFKESLSLVWVGLGLHLLVRSDARRAQRVGGILLILGGLAAATLMLKGILPLFREGDWGQAGRVDPWADPRLKLRYVIFLLIPLCGLPLLAWRSGIIALPSILLNLSTGYAPQYSSRFQYDDVIAPLLFAACIPAIEQAWRWSERLRTPARVALALAALYAAAVWHVDRSPLRACREPPAHDAVARIEGQVRQLAADHPYTWMYVQSHLGPHLHRYEMRQFPINARDCGRAAFRKDTLLVLSTNVPRWGFTDLDECLAEIDARSRFRRLPQYDPLRVYYVDHGL